MLSEGVVRAGPVDLEAIDAGMVTHDLRLRRAGGPVLRDPAALARRDNRRRRRPAARELSPVVLAAGSLEARHACHASGRALRSGGSRASPLRGANARQSAYERRADPNACRRPPCAAQLLLRERIAIDDAGLGNMWPVFYDTELFARVIEEMAAPFAGLVDKIAGSSRAASCSAPRSPRACASASSGSARATGLYPGETLSAFTS